MPKNIINPPRPSGGPFPLKTDEMRKVERETREIDLVRNLLRAAQEDRLKGRTDSIYPQMLQDYYKNHPNMARHYHKGFGDMAFPELACENETEETLLLPELTIPELAQMKTKGKGEYDTALPQPWVDDVKEKTGTYVGARGLFVWWYPSSASIWGEPLALTPEAERILQQYNDAVQAHR